MQATTEIRIHQTTANPEPVHRQPITGVQLRGIRIPSRTRPAGAALAITDLVLPAEAARVTIAPVRQAEATARIVLQVIPAAAAALTVVRAAQAAAVLLIIVPAVLLPVAVNPTAAAAAAAAHRVAAAVLIVVAHRAVAAQGLPGQVQEDPGPVHQDPGPVHQDQDVRLSFNPGSV
jgi:hypothetical protein